MTKIKLFIILLISLSSIAATFHHEKYFQQYVKYDMDVKLNIGLNRLDVDETLLYTNQSPDTLKEIYFFLYLNKYMKGSLVYSDLQFDRGSIRIFEVSENDSSTKDYSIDRTLMRLTLYNPLPTGYSVRFKFQFAAVLPSASERYGYQGYHYDVGNWYITPVVYDRAGWHLDQHLDNEFFQEWGDFRVNITVPKDFIVGATGNLLNESELLSDSTFEGKRNWLRVNPDDTTMVTWQFDAKNVHDFAWTTDPGYVLMKSEWNGITLNVLALDYNEKSWKQVKDWGIKAIQYFCENYGMYPYKQLTVADTYITAGGMEYPQIVMINDYINPDYQPSEFKAVVVHEMAHNWFYGLLANNQTEEEWLDEGFTTYAEIKVMEALFGRYGNMNPGNSGWYVNQFTYTKDDRLENALSYLQPTKYGLIDDQINLHADYLGSYAYALQYAKMADVLFMLEYTVGDSLFALGLKNYFNKWHYRHPYPEDFFEVMEETAGRDLDWFFEQWLNTDRKLDYAIEDYDGHWEFDDARKKYRCKIKFSREEKIFMPIDFDVTLKNGKVRRYQIPIDNFPKPEKDRTPLPYWHFNQKKYTADFYFDSEVEKIEIDPSLRLMDVNRLNNVTGFFPPSEFYFMKWQSYAPPLDKYVWELWPTAFYNDRDKAKLGFNLKGSYLNTDHILDIWVWYKTAWGLVDFDISYSTPKNWIGKLTWLETRLFTIDGRQGARLGLSHQIPGDSNRKITVKSGVANHQMFDSVYLMSSWDKGNVNTFYFDWELKKKYFRDWKQKYELNLDLQSSILGSRYQFSQASFEAKRKFYKTGVDWELDLRLFTGYSEGEVPDQFKFNLSGDNGWGEFHQQFYRSRGSLPYPWRRNGHLYKQGGGNVRGASLFTGNWPILDAKIATFNLDLKMPNPLETLDIPVIDDITPFLFADIGSVWTKNIPKIKEFNKSAGFSFEWDAYELLDYVFNLKSIKFDFPVWLGKVSEKENNIKLHWLVSFNFEMDN